MFDISKPRHRLSAYTLLSLFFLLLIVGANAIFRYVTHVPGALLSSNSRSLPTVFKIQDSSVDPLFKCFQPTHGFNFQSSTVKIRNRKDVFKSHG